MHRRTGAAGRHGVGLAVEWAGGGRGSRPGLGGAAGPRTVPACFSWGSWPCGPCLLSSPAGAVRTSSMLLFLCLIWVLPGAGHFAGRWSSREDSSRAEGWAPLRAVPCVASRWRVRPVDGGGSPAGLGSWSCAASFLGLGERLWECPVARRCRSRPLPFSRWVFVLRSLWFLFWARTLQFHSTEGAAGRRAFFLFQLAFPPSCGSGCRRPERPSLPSVSGFSF